MGKNPKRLELVGNLLRVLGTFSVIKRLYKVYSITEDDILRSSLQDKILLFILHLLDRFILPRCPCNQRRRVLPGSRYQHRHTRPLCRHVLNVLYESDRISVTFEMRMLLKPSEELIKQMSSLVEIS